jgi:hypothetical protein
LGSIIGKQHWWNIALIFMDRMRRKHSKCSIISIPPLLFYGDIVASIQWQCSCSRTEMVLPLVHHMSHELCNSIWYSYQFLRMDNVCIHRWIIHTSRFLINIFRGMNVTKNNWWCMRNNVKLTYKLYNKTNQPERLNFLCNLLFGT